PVGRVVDAGADLAGKQRVVGFVGPGRGRVIFRAGAREQRVGIETAPVELLAEREMTGALQEAVIVGLAQRGGEVVAARSEQAAAEGELDAVLRLPARDDAG